MGSSYPIFVKSNVIYAGKRVVTSEGKRFKIYLPIQFNDIWKELKGKEVRVYIVVDEE